MTHFGIQECFVKNNKSKISLAVKAVSCFFLKFIKKNIISNISEKVILFSRSNCYKNPSTTIVMYANIARNRSIQMTAPLLGVVVLVVVGRPLQRSV